VLAGRPNVGKSTLFNRLAHKRRAITDPTPGVTRDAIETRTLILDSPVTLIDTGGFKLDHADNDEDRLDALVVERTLETLHSADLIVLLFSAGEFSAEDEEFVSLVRPLYDKTIACVNKTEGGRLVAESCALHRFGFKELLFISAEHGDNVAELCRIVHERLSAAGKICLSFIEDEPQQEEPIRITLIGKPNTGKSTLSNRLTSSSGSLVSEIAGTTRDVIEGSLSYKGRRFITLDTAGIRRKTKVNEAIEYYSVNRAIKTLDAADVAVLLIDALEGLSEQDKKIAAQASQRGCPVIFALNKWDLVPPVKNGFTAMSDRLRFLFPQMAWAPIVPVSARTGDGVVKLLDMVIKVHTQLLRRIETSVFNDYLERWQIEYPPPSGPSTRFKIKYGLQISANPVMFKLFVSRPRAWTEAYGSYIANRLRKDAGYSMIPVRLEIAPSREDRHLRKKQR
jgi:GTP-binding protein